jgi:hypothetical protein
MQSRAHQTLSRRSILGFGVAVAAGPVQAQDKLTKIQFPQLSIPEDAAWFYVSDSFTIDLHPPIQLHYPGPANQSAIYLPGQNVLVYIKSCSFNLVAFAASEQGVNSDIRMALYDIDTLTKYPEFPNERPTFVSILPFTSPYGGAPGLIMNQTTKFMTPTTAYRDFGFSTPLKLGFNIPRDWSRRYQIGAAIQFNLGVPVRVQYEYHVHGAAKVL